MMVKKKTTLILIAFLVSTVLGPGLLGRLPAAAETHTKEVKQDASLTLITTVKPLLRAFPLRVPWIGTVASVSSVKLKALMEGRIEAIAVEDQAPIPRGAVLARLGGPQIKGERSRLEAEIGSLQARLDLAGQTLDRLSNSLKSQLATRDQVAAARAEQVTLEAQLRETRLKLETFEKKTSITAPVGGTFTGRTINVGQEVEAGQVIGAIVDPDHLRVEASLFLPQNAELRGAEAIIRGSGDQNLNGEVRSVLPETSDTGAVRVWIEGPEIDQRLRPGQTVGGYLVIGSDRKSLAVPEKAVVYDEEEHAILFVQKNGTYESLRVQTGRTQDGWIEILTELQPDQSVVTEGAYELFYRRFNERFKVPD